MIYALKRLIFFFLIVSATVSSADEKHLVLNRVLFNSTTLWHYSPVMINDSYSAKLHDAFLKRLDSQKRFFIQPDIEKLSVYRHDLDDQLFQGSVTFFDEANDIYEKRVKEAQSYVAILLKYSYVFGTREFIETDFDKLTYQPTWDALKDYWRKQIKYQLLTQYVSLIEAEPDPRKTELERTSQIKWDPKLEKKAREKVTKQMEQFFERLLEETKEDRRDIYLDTMMGLYDAHTNYFPPDKKEDFDISISGKLEGIGAVLKEDAGLIKVVRVVPGSAASRQGELKAEDIILKVSEGKKGQPFDLVGARVRDAVKLIRGEKGTIVTLTVKRPSGEIRDISIVRDVVVIEETYAKALLIKDNRYKETYGYIYLPKFYRDFKDRFGRNTTDDVKNALEELKTHHVKGIILDLRNNEGGALEDAVNTAGLFFDTGPVVQVKGRNNYSSVLNDKNKGTVYDGPLVVLTNTQSASASEILAAALQDYDRAVIVGSKSTYGKGTVQTFVNLPSQYPFENAKYKPIGDLKITIQKFYRINGGSTQYKGVIPDVELPDENGYADIGEKFLPNSLPWDTVDPLTYPKWQGGNLKVQVLREKSKVRVDQSTPFIALQTYVSEIKQEREDTQYPLSFKEALLKKQSIEAAAERYKKSQEVFEHLGFEVVDKMQGDKALQEEWLTGLSKDLYVNEAASVLHDLIHL